MTSVTRRAAFQSIAALGAAAAVPAAVSKAAELPGERAIRLAKELSVALRDYGDGGYMAIVETPEADGEPAVWFTRGYQSIPSDVMVAIRDWQRADKTKKKALDAYMSATEAAGHRGLHFEHPTRLTWMEADSDATSSLFRMLRLLEGCVA